MAIATGIIALLGNALQAYVKSVALKERTLDWQMGVDKAEKEQLKAENTHLKLRLAVYEAQNAKPGSGSDSGRL